MTAAHLTGITCVLFDMDGVLVDVSQSYRAAIAATAELFTGSPVEAATIQRYKNRGGFNDDWELTAAIVRDAGTRVDFEDVVTEFQRRYRGAAWDGLIRIESPLTDASELRRLASAGLELGIVTGRPAEEARWTIERFGWVEVFPVVIAREQQEDRPKPDGFPIRLALSRFAAGHVPERTVYVGDTVDDMRAAVDAGAVPIGFVPPYLDGTSHADLLRRHGARTVIGDHSELSMSLGISDA